MVLPDAWSAFGGTHTRLVVCRWSSLEVVKQGRVSDRKSLRLWLSQELVFVCRLCQTVNNSSSHPASFNSSTSHLGALALPAEAVEKNLPPTRSVVHATDHHFHFRN